MLRSSCETDRPKPLAMISRVTNETFLFPRSRSEMYVRPGAQVVGQLHLSDPAPAYDGNAVVLQTLPECLLACGRIKPGLLSVLCHYWRNVERSPRRHTA